MRRGVRVIAGALLGIALLYGVALALLWSQQTRMLYPAPQQRVALSPGFSDVTLRTEDGLDLRAFYRQAAEGLPTVVYLHGNAGSLTGATYETQALAEAGYGLLLVEYRGFGSNAGEPSEAGFYKDGRAAIAFLAENGIAPGNTIIAGNSIGSGTATQLATEFAPRALVLSSPFTSLRDVAAAKMPIFPVRHLMRDHFDNLSKMPQVSAPVLVLHGTADGLIPDSHGRALAEVAPRGTLTLIAGAGHDMSSYPEAQQAMVEWLDTLP